jgi:hypothetical protein
MVSLIAYPHELLALGFLAQEDGLGYTKNMQNFLRLTYAYNTLPSH